MSALCRDIGNYDIADFNGRFGDCLINLFHAVKNQCLIYGLAGLDGHDGFLPPSSSCGGNYSWG